MAVAGARSSTSPTSPAAAAATAATAEGAHRPPVDRRSRLGVVLLAAVAPLAAIAVDPAGWSSFGPVKWLAVSVLVPAGAALVLGTRPVRLRRGVTLATLALVGWMAVAAAFGVDPVYAWTGTPERHLGVLAWALFALALVAGQSLDVDDDVPVVAWGLVVAGVATGLVASVEALGWEPQLLDAATGRLTGTFGSAAYLGGATALHLPVAIGVAVDRRSSARLRAAGAVAVVPLLVACAGAGARAAWLGLLVAALVGAWCRRSELGARRCVVLPALVAVAVVVVALAATTTVGPRLSGMFDPDEAGGRGRLDEWRVAGRIIADDPLVGVGPEGYRVAFGAAADRSYERRHGRASQPDRAHAAPLDVAAAGGVPALAAWGALVLLVGRAAVGAVRRGRPMVAGMALALVAHLVGQLLLFPVVELEPVAWLLAGVVVAASPGRRRQWVVPRALRPVLAVVAAISLAAASLDLAADRRAAAASAALADGDARTAVAEAAAATSLRPDVLRLHLLEAKARLAADEGTVAALAAVDRGLAVSPGDPVALMTRVDLLVARAAATSVPEHAETARREIAGLLADDPANARLWLQAGSAADLAGRTDEAAAAWRRSEDLAPDSAAPSINLALLHLASGDPGRAQAALDRAERRAPGDPRMDEVRELIRDRR